MQIKVCGLKYPENISDILETNVDYLGMIFHPQSARFVSSANNYKNIPNAKKVGVFVNKSADEIINFHKDYQFNTVQLHGNENNNLVNELKNKGLNVWKAFGVDIHFNFDILNNFPDVDAFLFDTFTTQHGGSGKKFDWQILQGKTFTKNFWLSGGISLEDAEELQNFYHPNCIGLDINSKFELEPGLKDVQKIKEFKQKINQSLNS